MPRRLPGAPRHDLFELFPDLPWPGTRRSDAHAARIQRLIAETRERAARNIERQKAASAQVRQRVVERQAEMLARRDRSPRRRP